MGRKTELEAGQGAGFTANSALLAGLFCHLDFGSTGPGRRKKSFTDIQTIQLQGLVVGRKTELGPARGPAGRLDLGCRL